MSDQELYDLIMRTNNLEDDENYLTDGECLDRVLEVLARRIGILV